MIDTQKTKKGLIEQINPLQATCPEMSKVVFRKRVSALDFFWNVIRMAQIKRVGRKKNNNLTLFLLDWD